MEYNPDFRVFISFSEKVFTRKLDRHDPNWKYYAFWEKQTPTLVEFRQKLEEGYGFVGQFEGRRRNTKNFDKTSVLFFDVDDSDVSMEIYISRLPIKPTFAFTTWQDEVVKGVYRFKLIYVFKEPITAKNFLPLYNQIEKMLGIHVSDSYGHVMAQFCYPKAPSPKGRFWISDNVFGFEDFEYTPIMDSGAKDSMNKTKKKTQKTEMTYRGFLKELKNGPIKIWVEREIKKDLLNYDFKTFLDVYKKKGCPVIEESLIQYNEDGIAKLPDNYIEIPHRWKNKSGGTCEVYKRPDHQRRRQHLWWDALRIRKIKPDVFQSTLAYNIVYQAYHHTVYDDPKDPIKGQDIINIMLAALNADIDNPEISKKLISTRAGHYTSSKEWCEEHGYDRKKYCKEYLKKVTEAYIESFYDITKSVKYNFEHQPEEGNPSKDGEKVPEGTLKAYVTRHVIGRKQIPNKMNSVYYRGLKRKDALKMIKDKNLSISKRTVYDFYKKNKINPKTGIPLGQLF